MPPAYEVLLLNTAIPQIQAAQSGDTYVVPRDIAFSAALTLSAGTANGVPYLNGSKVVTTGSALTFDGTNFYTTAQLIAGAGSANANVVARSNVANGGAGFSQFLFGNTSSDSRGYLSYSHAADSILFGSAGGTRMTLNDSGNLGLGATPSAWGSGYAALQIKQTALYTTATEVELGSNHFVNSSGQFAYIGNGFATRYEQYLGAHSWHTAPNNTSGAGFAPISFTQAMTLDASGNLAIGRTSVTTIGNGYRTIDMDGDNGSGLRFRTNGTSVGIAYVAGTSYLELGTIGSAYLRFAVNGGDEKARITSGGYFKASDNGTYGSSTGTYHELYQSANSSGVEIRAVNASYSSTAVFIVAARNTTNNSFYAIDYYNTGAAAFKFRVADSGDVTNTNGTYGTISDAKMKTDIVDAGSQWADIKALRFRKFKMKDDPSGLVQLGVVAQEVELTSPGLVDEHADKDAEGNDLGTTTKSVKTSVLLMKAAVALQEAMARIETLEAEVAALKGA